jgi:Family of unknown function (DUF6804)
MPLRPVLLRKTKELNQETRIPMFTKFMKWFSIGVLLLAVFWRSSANFQLLLELVICVASLLVITQAVRTGKYLWAAGFLAIAVLFNPVVPVKLPGQFLLVLDLSCLMVFLASLIALKTRPILAIPSIIGRRTGSESL